jgi:hypothetical protein
MCINLQNTLILLLIFDNSVLPFNLQSGLVSFQSKTTQLHRLGDEYAAKGAHTRENNTVPISKNYKITRMHPCRRKFWRNKSFGRVDDTHKQNGSTVIITRCISDGYILYKIYLGSALTEDNDITIEVKERIWMANRAIYDVRKQLRSDI